MNKVFLVGNLTADPILKQTSTGKSLVNFTVACNDMQNSNHSNFFACVSWNNQANYIANYVKKGNTVAIDGHLNRRSYVNKEGRNVYVTEIIVENIKTIARKQNFSSGQENTNSFAEKIDKKESPSINSQPSQNENQTTNSLDDLSWINEEKSDQ